MDSTWKYFSLRIAPVVMVALAAGAWFNEVQSGGPHVLRNLAPLFVLVALAAVTLYRGGGEWRGAGMKLPLGTLGYAVPALGLGLYLHYAYSVNLNDMFTDAAYPTRIFQYLPFYTLGAGLVGFAIGWLVGRNL